MDAVRRELKTALILKVVKTERNRYTFKKIMTFRKYLESVEEKVIIDVTVAFVGPGCSERDKNQISKFLRIGP